ncbi:SDR family oxidoreductase [Phycicoccus sonneratiae]|uniref:SDR family oxidoreductase n=1 Tax=Phycicoccus sonneratiae TaxID=2807628 RepID=A0ABS2CTX8_9MICO|nr:SDR family oxidoreductase [Phycicoccus sonneraticus]MBM6402596.1 SDR family oxidoreductase [Phycicoccus sonneraticus]
MSLTDLLVDRVVLVVGATSGVGEAVARAAAREGAYVTVAGRRTERADALAAQLSDGGSEALAVWCDVADPASAVGAVAATVERFGRIDGLVNSAGLTTRGTLLDTTPELFDAHVATNLRGPFFTMQAAVADMRRRGAGGAVVNIISSAELGGQPYLAPYAATKAGLATLTRNAAFAHRWDRIRINGLDIGWTETEGEADIQRRFHGAGEDWVERAAASVPMGRLGQVDEIADMVVFLLSDRSGVVTGSVVDWDQIIQGCQD